MRHVNVIADIGINHNGDLKIAKQLAWEAKLAGADYVKLQKRTPERCYTPEELDAPCDSPWGRTVRDKVVGRELSWDDIARFNEYCWSIAMPWSASCFDLQSLYELHDFYPKRPWNKIASCMALDAAFVQAVAAQGMLTLVSFGLANESVQRRVVTELTHRRCGYVLNHCVARYPTPIAECNMLRLLQLRALSGDQIGYSGHETCFAPAIMAVALGAEWIEHHITHNHDAYGADHKCSFTGEEFKTMVSLVRTAEEALGDGRQHLTGKEKVPVRITHPWPEAEEA